MSAPGRSERDAWLALASVEGVGDVTLARCIRRFGSAEATLRVIAGSRPDRASRLLRETLPGIRGGVVERIVAAAADPDAIHRALAAHGAWAVTPLDPAYPAQLRELDPPPLVLHGVGDAALVGVRHAVAVVGTRHPTPAGRAMAARIARRLVEADVAVISGLAIGIDGAAHAATVEAGGRTVAVIGGGFDHPGPRAHDRLRAAILAGGGAVVSEHAPSIAPSRGTFPRRNRIISVLAAATIVVEAPVRSGALITARHALEQGRRLLVVPGRPGDPSTEGCLGLLRETPARPLVGLDEMLADLGLDSETRDDDGAEVPALGRDAALALLGPVERSVARTLAAGPVTTDRIMEATGLSAAVVSGALTLLQLRGWAQPMGPLQLAAGPLLAEPRRRVRRTGGVR
ncbi:MAG: DNA-processing protein DprA [Chloroflexota bacterium]